MGAGVHIAKLAEAPLVNSGLSPFSAMTNLFSGGAGGREPLFKVRGACSFFPARVPPPRPASARWARPGSIWARGAATSPELARQRPWGSGLPKNARRRGEARRGPSVVPDRATPFAPSWEGGADSVPGDRPRLVGREAAHRGSRGLGAGRAELDGRCPAPRERPPQQCSCARPSLYSGRGAPLSALARADPTQVRSPDTGRWGAPPVSPRGPVCGVDRALRGFAA